MNKVTFWGTRGSLPVAATSHDIRQKLIAALLAARGQVLDDRAAIEDFVAGLPFAVNGTFGGNSSCVEITGIPGMHVVCDLGSGARPLAQAKLAEFGSSSPQTYHLFISHLHWDHLMGLPFFSPLYLPGNQIVFHGCHDGLEAAVRRQLHAPHFPVEFNELPARIHFERMTPGVTHEIGPLRVTPIHQQHAGDSYGYRFEHDGKCVVYSTDSEHRLEDTEQRAAFIRFFDHADLLIFDSMYSLAEAVSIKADWGHSSNVVAVELSQAAAVRQLALFHHEPVHDDAQLEQLLKETRRLEEITRAGRSPLNIVSAYDGLSIAL